MRSSKILIILFLAVFTFTLRAQPGLPQEVKDSLWKVWNSSKIADSSRLLAMNQIIRQGYLFIHPDSAFLYAEKMYQYAESRKLKKYMAMASNIQGISFAVRSDNTNALKYYTKGLNISEKINDKKAIAGSYNNIGNIYLQQGNVTLALEYFTKSLIIKEAINDLKGISNSSSNIGMVYQDLKETDQAIEYYRKSLAIEKKIGDENGIASSYINLGSSYEFKKQFDSAYFYYNKGLRIAEKISNYELIAQFWSNLGNLEMIHKNYDTALDYQLKSQNTFEKIGNLYGIIGTSTNIGTIYKMTGKYALCIKYNEFSLSKAVENGFLSLARDAAENLWVSYKNTGNFKKAVEMQELFYTYRDSIISEENQKELYRQKYKYEYDKQAAEDSIVNAEAQKVRDMELEKEKALSDQQELELKNKRIQQYGLIIGIIILIIFSVFIFNRFRITNQQKKIIESQKKEVEFGHLLLEEKNKEILDSINYAKRIQNAILPPQKLVKEFLPQSFILYKPKDIVAGDFYWLETLSQANPLRPADTSPDSEEERANVILFAACDCTGHGVPGAMVSVVCNNGLNRAVREYGLTDPGKILDKTRELVIQEFEKSEEDVKDGMDIALCAFEVQGSMFKVKYSGANNPLWLIRQTNFEPETLNFELIEYKANKQPIGQYADPKPFTTHEFELHKGDTIYIFTDGFQDQFGGEKGKKLKTKTFKELLLSIQEKTMDEQRSFIDHSFETWKSGIEQNDDVCVIGIRV